MTKRSDKVIKYFARLKFTHFPPFQWKVSMRWKDICRKINVKQTLLKEKCHKITSKCPIHKIKNRHKVVGVKHFCLSFFRGFMYKIKVLVLKKCGKVFAKTEWQTWNLKICTLRSQLSVTREQICRFCTPRVKSQPTSQQNTNAAPHESILQRPDRQTESNTYEPNVHVLKHKRAKKKGVGQCIFPKMV